MKKLSLSVSVCLSFGLLVCLSYLQKPSFANQDYPLVQRVIDGDTIALSADEKVRLLGVDTPELHHPQKPVQCFAREAMEYTRQRVEGKSVKLTYEGPPKDRYGRILAWVWYGEGFKQLLNADIIRDGYGFSYRKYPTSKLEEFNKLETYARDNNLGLWANSTCNGQAAITSETMPVAGKKSEPEEYYYMGILEFWGHHT